MKGCMEVEASSGLILKLDSAALPAAREEWAFMLAVLLIVFFVHCWLWRQLCVAQLTPPLRRERISGPLSKAGSVLEDRERNRQCGPACDAAVQGLGLCGRVVHGGSLSRVCLRHSWGQG